MIGDIDNFNSQSRIETYLDGLFKQPGYFLEIGCWNGELISQTMYLERFKGWKGLCVDPFPTNFERRECELCARAVSADGAPREFIKVSIDRRYGGDVSYFSGFRDSIQVHWPLISEFCDYEQIWVETITFVQLCAQYGVPDYVDFLSIDTEGSELEIFKSIDFSCHRFGMIMFEHNQNQEVQAAIRAILQKNGYQLFLALTIDDVYINTELEDQWKGLAP